MKAVALGAAIAPLVIVCSAADSSFAETDGGILMWALGKSATDYFAKSLVKTAGWKFCNGDKESFKPALANGKALPRLNPTNLRNCLVRGERLAHIKPEHIKHGDLEHTPDGFFQAAADAGWTVVVALHRENSFSRQLSGINWALRHQRDQDEREHEFFRHFCERGDVISGQYERERQMIADGIRAALRAGLRVLFLTYSDVTDEACASVKDVLTFYNSTETWPKECVLDVNNGHSRTHVDLSLDAHLGPRALNCTKSTFSNHTGWNWMLDEDGRRSAPPVNWPWVYHGIVHPNFFHRADMGNVPTQL